MEQVLEKGESTVYGDFVNILKSNSKWSIGSYKLQDGSTWLYREPDATIMVQNGRLKVRANPFTRAHSTVQTLDNAKHMYFSKERFDVPRDGEIAFELEMRAIVHNGHPGDVYDGFSSVNLLDIETGISADWFLGGDQAATVYARVHSSGGEPEDNGVAKFFAIFNEIDLTQPAEEPHRFKIHYSRSRDTLTWFMDDREVHAEDAVPGKVNGFNIAIGLMTNKDLRSAGSVSLHGQGVTGEWSPIRVTKIHHGR
jgi:hypothetical protein